MNYQINDLVEKYETIENEQNDKKSAVRRIKNNFCHHRGY